MASSALYDLIGSHYTATRSEDPRIARVMDRALGDARSVLNVGAGTGSYEPTDREVIAVEPSTVMIAQRPADAAPAVWANAEELPFADRSFDAVMAILSDHHWRDRLRGLRELRRVARQRVVLFNADPAQGERFWLTTEYLPAFLRLIPDLYRAPGMWGEELARELGEVRVEPVPIPRDCSDGFYGAFWRRPAAYLDRRVRDGISVFSRLGESEIDGGLARLHDDLESGAWNARHSELLELEELDLGYYVVIAEFPREGQG
jgi:SAM-dependent methyltransferase